MAASMRVTCEAASLGEMHALGDALAQALREGDVISMVGSLGAGKTAFVQGACRGLGVDDVVSSPTFVLVRDYDGRVPVHHVDVYRLNALQDVIDLGFDEMLGGDGVTFIEWGDAVESLFAEAYLEVRLEADPATESRTVTFSAHGAEWDMRLASEVAPAVASWVVPA